MLPVFPVYPYSLCLSRSTHAGALPGPVYPYFDNHKSTEFHPVMLIPGPWVKKSGRVFGDANVLMLDGHDTGMGIPHLSPIMDNMMLPITMATSSCKWPFVCLNKKVNGKGTVAFLYGLAPFVFCDSPAAGKPSSKDVQKGLPYKPPPSPPTKKPAGKLAAFSEKTGFKMSMSGRGKFHLPACATVMMRMSFAELLLGWAKFLVERALDAAWGAAMSHVPSGGKRLARLDSDVARSRALREFTKGQARVLRRAAARDYMQDFAVQLAWKSTYDGVLKSMLLDCKLKAPYGLFSLSFADEKIKFLWRTHTFGPCPIEFKGVKGMLDKALEGAIYQPQVDELLADNPNHASAPKGSTR